MVSDNGKNIFYLQSTGNLVVNEYERTMWSSNTAILEPFNGPFTLSFFSIVELVLRDKYKYITWYTINPYIVANADKLNITYTDMNTTIDKSNETNKPDKPTNNKTNNSKNSNYPKESNKPKDSNNLKDSNNPKYSNNPDDSTIDNNDSTNNPINAS
ncbi:hypothetical protein LY90DRAFT_502884 [Neocallimastix californiae]|uniref:Bulb-type lectin domain-containing protein n=1 Tax=Neocallimastix californiae TaxID=1754190 RepID=A0A1Y2ET58_9FUNG|nr:hypothetical protein LY90DRAFT_502884 [Neocallimastix californiae]|eukprot:ORY74025.1 hypothetical protein LY90DRAFT_502884 [Neocallimastix californiae]